jgi:hypothetical protein
MARIRKCIFAASCATSLILCVAACALWVTSYWVTTNFEFDWQSQDVESQRSTYLDGKASAGGIFGGGYSHTVLLNPRDGCASVWGPVYNYYGGVDGHTSYPKIASERWLPLKSLGYGFPATGHSFAGFKFEAYKTPVENNVEVVLPFWIVVLLTSIAPALYWRQIRRRRRAARLGYCRKCGYDLRASRDRCPECGAAMADSLSLPLP